MQKIGFLKFPGKLLLSSRGGEKFHAQFLLICAETGIDPSSEGGIKNTNSRRKIPPGKQRVFLHSLNISFIVSSRSTSVSRPVLDWIRADPINAVINGANFTWTLRIITSCSPSPPSSCQCRSQPGRRVAPLMRVQDRDGGQRRVKRTSLLSSSLIV